MTKVHRAAMQGLHKEPDSVGGTETSIPGSISTLLASQYQEGYRMEQRGNGWVQRVGKEDRQCDWP